MPTDTNSGGHSIRLPPLPRPPAFILIRFIVLDMVRRSDLIRRMWRRDRMDSPSIIFVNFFSSSSNFSTVTALGSSFSPFESRVLMPSMMTLLFGVMGSSRDIQSLLAREIWYWHPPWYTVQLLLTPRLLEATYPAAYDVDCEFFCPLEFTTTTKANTHNTDTFIFAIFP